MDTDEMLEEILSSDDVPPLSSTHNASVFHDPSVQKRIPPTTTSTWPLLHVTDSRPRYLTEEVEKTRARSAYIPPKPDPGLYLPLTNEELKLLINEPLQATHLEPVAPNQTCMMIRDNFGLVPYSYPRFRSRIHIHFSHPSNQIRAFKSFSAPMLESIIFPAVLIVEGDFVLSQVDTGASAPIKCEMFIITLGHPSVIKYIRGLLNDNTSIFLTNDTTSYIYNPYPQTASALLPCIAELEAPVVLGDIPFLYNMLLCAHITSETKFLSLAYLLFPHVQQAFRSSFQVLSKSDAIAYFGGPLATLKALPESTISHKFMTAIPVYMLHYGYSRADKIVKQITKRANSAQAGTMFPVINESDVTTVLNETHAKDMVARPMINQALGFILAIDKTGTYNPLVKSCDLMDYNTLVTTTNISKWTGKVYDQMRLIYHNAHSTSVRMGISVLHILKAAGVQHDPLWVGELNRIEDAIALTDNIPYVSLQRESPYAIQIKNFPKVVLIGIRFHGSTLPNSNAKDEFKYFITRSVEQHIPTDMERVSVDIHFSILPDPCIRTMADIIQNLTLDMAELALSGYDDVKKNKLYGILSGMAKALKKTPADMGSWFIYTMRQRDLQQISKSSQEAMEKCGKRFSERMPSESAKIAVTPEGPEKVKMLEQYNKWTAYVNSMLGAETDMGVLLDPALYSDTDNIRTLIGKHYTQVLKAIKEGPGGFDSKKEDMGSLLRDTTAPLTDYQRTSDDRLPPDAQPGSSKETKKRGRIE